MTERLYIIAAKRTPNTRILGTLSTHSAAQLGSHAARAALLQSGLDGGDLDSIILGQTLPAGQGTNVARQIALAAGITEDIPAASVNMGALSGLKSLIDACAQLKAGDADLILTIASDSASNSGFLLPASLRQGHPHGHLTGLDLTQHDANPHSERAEHLARHYRLNREQQDTYAHTSRQNTINARENGHYANEISALSTRHDQILEHTAEHLAKLPALHSTISTGNRAAHADGASAIILASHSALRRHNLTALAEITGYGQSGGNSEQGALAAVPAIAQALERSGHLLPDIQRLEIEESHAADVLAILHELAAQHDTTFHTLSERTNPDGGSLALGQTPGGAGHRLVTSLTYALARNNQRLGLAAQGSGDGQGAAIILQKTH